MIFPQDGAVTFQPITNEILELLICDWSKQNSEPFSSKTLEIDQKFKKLNPYLIFEIIFEF